VEAFSRYDAGWLHVFESRNGGDIRRADWDDLNLPARLSTLAAAGLPVIHRRNDGAVVATEALADRLGIGVSFTDLDELAATLRDERAMAGRRAAMAAHRAAFTFDHHADDLVAFFRTTIDRAGGARRRGTGNVARSAALTAATAHR
jgi:hypothetical protein